MIRDTKKRVNSDRDYGRRPSWPYPIMIILYVAIFLSPPILGEMVSLALFLVLVSFCVWAAVSKRNYEKLKINYPELTRSDYMLNMLIFPVILPLIIFILVLVFR